jgi:putative MATE family efflux protein
MFNNNSDNDKENDTNKFHLVKINNSDLIVSKYSDLNNDSRNRDHLNEEEMKLYFFETVRKIIKIGLPTTLFFLSLYVEQAISLAFIGKKYNNPDMINAMGIVNLYIDCTFFSLVIGLLAGLDTLLSNSLGTKNYYLFGLYVHRARLITYLISTVLFIFHYFYGLSIISLFKIEKSALEYCSRFFYPSLLYIMLMIQFTINFRVLSILERSRVCIVTLVITTLMHPLWCHLFINVFGYDLLGAGYSLMTTQFINMTVSTIYLHFFHPNKETYFCINKDCFTGWVGYLKFTLPSTFVLFADSMAYQIQAIFAIFMTKEDYALHIMVSNLANIFFTLTHGFGIAATVMIAEKIAKNLIKESKAIALYSFILAEIIMSIVVIILILFRNKVITIFIDDDSLISKGIPLVVLLAVGEIFDITQGVMACIYKGLGKQRHASIISFFQFYVVQIILSYILGIQFNMGVMGIWLSILIGNLLTTLIYIYFLTGFNFEQINRETTERLEKDQKLISNNKLDSTNNSPIEELS